MAADRPNPLTVRLNDGRLLPRIGLGVYQVPRGETTRVAVRTALALGYRHIDTARAYGNETEVGEAIRESSIPRHEIFVTTKLWNDDHGYEAALKAGTASLKRLGLDSIDLYLIHWPVLDRRRESWRALERLQKDGIVRSIGVSNYMAHHLDEMLHDARVLPTVNQIELSPFLQQRKVREWCAKHDVVVEAYSPLTRGQRLDHPLVQAIAARLHKSPAQVLLRWGLEHELVILPKSTDPARLAENFNVFDFELGAANLAELDQLEEGLVTGWDPRSQP